MSATITLTVFEGGSQEKEFVFEEPAQSVVGRSEDCDIQLPTEEGHLDVSRHHCLFTIDPPLIRVRDLGSRNGTYVNGEKIGQRSRRTPPQPVELDAPADAERELKPGDEVQVGHAVFLVDVLAS